MMIPLFLLNDEVYINVHKIDKIAEDSLGNGLVIVEGQIIYSDKPIHDVVKDINDHILKHTQVPVI